MPFIARCSGPWTATFSWPEGDRLLLNTGIFSLPLKKLALSYDRGLSY